MAAPVGSLKDLQELLEDRGGYVFEQRPFPFYSVLLYTPSNSLNKLLHEYVVSHFELFNAQTGPNWLVAVLEDINRAEQIGKFKPEDVYQVARFLGVGVDAIPAIVFFTEPKERKDTLVLNLRDILPEASSITDDKLTQLFSKLAAKIDDISQRNLAGDARLEVLRKDLIREWPDDLEWGQKLASAVEWVKISAVTATSVLGAISGIVEFLQGRGIYLGG